MGIPMVTCKFPPSCEILSQYSINHSVIVNKVWFEKRFGTKGSIFHAKKGKHVIMTPFVTPFSEDLTYRKDKTIQHYFYIANNRLISVHRDGASSHSQALINLHLFSTRIINFSIHPIDLY